MEIAVGDDDDTGDFPPVANDGSCLGMRSGGVGSKGEGGGGTVSLLSPVLEAAVRRLLKPVCRGKKTETTAARAIRLGI
jgi:hypothetical protein